MKFGMVVVQVNIGYASIDRVEFLTLRYNVKVCIRKYLAIYFVVGLIGLLVKQHLRLCSRRNIS